MAEAAEGNDAIRPFRVNVPEEKLVDLRRRIARLNGRKKDRQRSIARGASSDDGAARGYWATITIGASRAKLNALPQFITQIDGLDIHFIHVRSKHENALPMIVTHGWPGSIIEQLKIIDLLAKSHGPWRERIRRVRSGDSVDTGARIFRQADPPAGAPIASRAPGSKR